MSPCEQQRKIIDEYGWFKDHVAAQKRDDLIVWKKPGTGIYSVHYLIYGNTLFVCGDLGEAAYQWSQKIDWDFLSGLNCDYFLGKCQASEVGRRFVEWDAKYARARLEETFKGLKEGGYHISAGACCDAISAVETKEDWHSFIMDHRDIYELLDLGDLEVPNLRGVSHWYGLTLALKQLRAKAESVIPAAEATPK